MYWKTLLAVARIDWFFIYFSQPFVRGTVCCSILIFVVNILMFIWYFLIKVKTIYKLKSFIQYKDQISNNRQNFIDRIGKQLVKQSDRWPRKKLIQPIWETVCGTVFTWRYRWLSISLVDFSLLHNSVL